MCLRDCGSEDGLTGVEADRLLVAMEVRHGRSDNEEMVMKERVKGED